MKILPTEKICATLDLLWIFLGGRDINPASAQFYKFCFLQPDTTLLTISV